MSKELIPESNRPKRTILGTLVAVVVALFCVVYILNPTAGFF